VEHAEILDRIRSIPPGRVAAYSDITPHAPRLAGRVLAGTGEPDLPWHRVVRADGSLAKGRRQRERLVAEGVGFRGERVDMARFRI
jgi:alkylated DNA nucleotide flippase Atl1